MLFDYYVSVWVSMPVRSLTPKVLVPGPHAVYRHLYVHAIRRVVGGFLFRSLLAGYKETISHHTQIFPALLRYSGRSKLMQFYININVFSIKFDHTVQRRFAKAPHPLSWCHHFTVWSLDSTHKYKLSRGYNVASRSLRWCCQHSYLCAFATKALAGAGVSLFELITSLPGNLKNGTSKCIRQNSD